MPPAGTAAIRPALARPGLRLPCPREDQSSRPVQRLQAAHAHQGTRTPGPARRARPGRPAPPLAPRVTPEGPCPCASPSSLTWGPAMAPCSRSTVTMGSSPLVHTGPRGSKDHTGRALSPAGQSTLALSRTWASLPGLPLTLLPGKVSHREGRCIHALQGRVHHCPSLPKARRPHQLCLVAPCPGSQHQEEGSRAPGATRSPGTGVTPVGGARSPATQGPGQGSWEPQVWTGPFLPHCASVWAGLSCCPGRARVSIFP